MHFIESDIRTKLEQVSEELYCVAEVLRDGPDFHEDLEMFNYEHRKLLKIEKQLNTQYASLQRALVLAQYLDIWNGDDLSW